MLYARINGNWTSVSSPPTNEVAVQAEPPSGSEELWYDTDAPGVTPDDLRWMSAWGQVAGTWTTTPVTATTSYTNLCSVTFTAVAGRRYAITAQSPLRPSTAGSLSYLELYDATAGTTLRESFESIPVAQYYQTIDVTWFWSPAAGSRTISLRAKTSSGTVESVVAGGGIAASLLIEDIGPILGSVVPNPITVLDRWNTAWGEVYYAEQTSSSTALTTTPASLWQINLTGLTVGRKLKITASTGTGSTVNTPNSEIFFGIGDVFNTIWHRVRVFNPTANLEAGADPGARSSRGDDRSDVVLPGVRMGVDWQRVVRICVSGRAALGAGRGRRPGQRCARRP